MQIAPDLRMEVAQLLSFLMQGERLAHEGALRQAGMAKDPGARRFLLAQAQQEVFHARIFQSLIDNLVPKGVKAPPGLAVMERYRACLMDAIERRDFAESLLAQQVVLEGLGQVVLTRLDAGVTKRGLGLARLRHLVLNQEKAHHGFGLHCLQRLVKNHQAETQSLRERCQEYLALTHSMLAMLSDFFVFFDENPEEYIQALHRHLPSWINEVAT